MALKDQNLTSNLVFFFSSSIILLNLLSIVFPALLLRLSSGSGLAGISPYELGTLAIPLITTNAIFFCLIFLYKKNLLPSYFYKTTQFLTSFDISNKLAILILLLVIVTYTIFSFEEVLEPEIWPDRARVDDAFNKWNSDDSEFDFSQLHTKMFFLTISEELFHNLRILPLIASISLLVLSYYFTVQLSSKRISGLIAVIIILQSTIFRLFDTSYTYSNFWVVFYLLSLYLVKKKWHFSFMSYIVSFLAKTLTLAYLPLSILFILHSSLSTRKKFFTILTYFIIIVALSIIIFNSDNENSRIPTDISFHVPKFFSGFSVFPLQLRFDIFIVMLLMPLNFLLFLKARKGQKSAQSIQILISGILLSGPLMTGFLDFVINPYRFVPVIIFFAVGFGLLFSKNYSSKINCQ